jgi:CRISPR-associated protein Cas1
MAALTGSPPGHLQSRADISSPAPERCFNLGTEDKYYSLKIIQDGHAQYPWLAVTGFGSHIKSTKKMLVVGKDRSLEEYPIDRVGHLLIVGGHTIHSAAITALVKAGAMVSFFEADGEPVGYIRRYGEHRDEYLAARQREIPAHRFAVRIAEGAIRSRLLVIEETSHETGMEILYQGELEIVHQALSEIEYLIRLEEVGRLNRLIHDMYYEIMARSIPPEYEFRRRSSRPFHDVINAMLSFGYAMLFGNACIAILGARLDPDAGMLFQGERSLVYDMIEPMKADMIDRPVFSLARSGISPRDYESSGTRTILSDPCMKQLIALFHGSIKQDLIDEQVRVFHDALLGQREFAVVYR